MANKLACIAASLALLMAAPMADAQTKPKAEPAKKKQDFFSQDNGLWAAAAGDAAITAAGMAFAGPQQWTEFPKGGGGVAMEGDLGSGSR
jgi:hypothetical protein